MRVVAGGLWLVLITSSWSIGQATRPDAAKTGEDDFFPDQRSRLSAIDVQHARYGVERAKPNVYDLKDERIRVIVPEEFAADGSWGIITWCDAGRGGRIPRELTPLLAKKKLIAACAYNAGNDRGVAVRIGLMLDAVHALRPRYALDEHRTYAGGISGGAKVAQMAALAFPEVFDGAISCAGASWFKDMPVPEKPNTFWPRAFAKPPVKTFADARDHVGFVLITGEKDGNYTPMKVIFERGFQADGFKHALLYDVPGFGHQVAPTEWLEKAIDELDALPKTREKKLPATQPARRPAASRPATRAATRPHPLKGTSRP